MFWSGVDAYDLKVCGWFAMMSTSFIAAIACLSAVSTSAHASLAALGGMSLLALGLLALLQMWYIQRLQIDEQRLADEVSQWLEEQCLE